MRRGVGDAEGGAGGEQQWSSDQDRDNGRMQQVVQQLDELMTIPTARVYSQRMYRGQSSREQNPGPGLGLDRGTGRGRCSSARVKGGVADLPAVGKRMSGMPYNPSAAFLSASTVGASMQAHLYSAQLYRVGARL
jgi:hypothetical protein